MKTVALYFLLFIIYSMIGWVIECIDVYIEDKKLMNRGFLIGPYCPIYGVGSVIIIYFFSRYKDDLVVLFIVSMFVCSFLEYFTSWLMEKLFKARWWDYSNKRFNLNGRICLANMIGFGLGSVLIVCFAQPFIWKLINMLSPMTINILFVVSLCIFLIDCIVSFNIITKFKNVAKSVNKDSTEEITNKVRAILYKEGGLYRRLVSVFNFEASDLLLSSIKSKVKNQTIKAKKRFMKEKQRLRLLTKRDKLEREIKRIDNEIKESDK